VAQIKDVLSRFVAWSQHHPGARCPDLAAVGANAPDPWGHSLRLSCVEQPADQVAAVVSVGPDGVAGTLDDVASWTLGPEVTSIVRGPRWSSTRRGTAGAGRNPSDPAGRAPRAASSPTATVDSSLTAPGGTTSGRTVHPPAITPATRPATRPSASTGAGSNDTVGDGIPDRR
jgi:hypothetical protein